MKIKSSPVPISPEKNPKLWNDQWGDTEKITQKLEEVLSYTTGMASLTACARLLGRNAFLRSISDKECLNMTEGLLQAIVDGVKEIAAEKDREMPRIKIKLQVSLPSSG